MSIKCRFCDKELPIGLNGNRRYCNDNCYYYAKLMRTNEKYAVTKNTLLEINRCESLLRSCYNKYDNTPFDVNILRTNNMDWKIHTGYKDLDGKTYTKIGLYAYVIFENNTIQILNLNL